MKIKIKIESVITIFLIAGLFSFFLYSLIYDIPKTTYYEIEGLSSRILKYLGTFLLVIVILLSFIFEIELIPTYIINLVTLLLIWLLFVEMPGFPVIFYTYFLFGPKGIGTFFLLFLCVVSINPRRWKAIDLTFLILVNIYALYALFEISKLGISFSRTDTRFLMKIIIELAWISPYFILKPLEKKGGWMLLYFFPFFIFFITSIITSTRSLILLSLLYSIIFLIKIRKNKKQILTFFSSLILLASAAVIIAKTSRFASIITVGYSNLVDRLYYDSRTTQIQDFFAQADWKQFLLGAGPFATWRWLGIEYEWLDNIWVLYAWWAGILFVILYFLFLFKPSIKLLNSGLTFENKAIAYMILFWILALGGFSVFTMPGSKMYFFFINLLIGRVIYQSKYKTNLEL